MKNQIFYLLLFVLMTLTFSCSSDDDLNDVVNDETPQPTLFCGEDPMTGTICCINGSLTAGPGETLSYTYSSNTDNNVFDWTVLSGSISIVSGQNSQTVTVEFGNDFTDGMILCAGDGDLECHTTLRIK